MSGLIRWCVAALIGIFGRLLLLNFARGNVSIKLRDSFP